MIKLRLYTHIHAQLKESKVLNWVLEFSSSHQITPFASDRVYIWARVCRFFGLKTTFGKTKREVSWGWRINIRLLAKLLELWALSWPRGVVCVTRHRVGAGMALKIEIHGIELQKLRCHGQWTHQWLNIKTVTRENTILQHPSIQRLELETERTEWRN